MVGRATRQCKARLGETNRIGGRIVLLGVKDQFDLSDEDDVLFVMVRRW